MIVVALAPLAATQLPVRDGPWCTEAAPTPMGAVQVATANGRAVFVGDPFLVYDEASGTFSVAPVAAPDGLPRAVVAAGPSMNADNDNRDALGDLRLESELSSLDRAGDPEFRFEPGVVLADLLEDFIGDLWAQGRIESRRRKANIALVRVRGILRALEQR